MTIGRLGQRFEVDFKIADNEYCVQFEITPKEKSVTIGAIKQYKDKFDTVGQFVDPDTRPKFYERVQDYLEGYIWAE